ncbi:hypothetical protein HK103_002412 [Boothiomyces macroporosus]|uniref:Magnesium-transporting ATPase, P-type 1 n=1 Tax=Boothiomyces macroporosus TaxID=261099 RepID=A0AAD5U9F3_9FUNG|nr:hypothetical protein HK103_002412 [Boothiomyces macroporosus]
MQFQVLVEKPQAEYDLSITNEIKHIQLDHPSYGPIADYEHQELQEKYGKNILSVSKPMPWYKLLFFSVFQMFNLILLFLAAISFATEDYVTMTIMLVMVSSSSLLKFYQELKSNIACQALKNMVQNHCTVIRKYSTPIDRDPSYKDVELMDSGYMIEKQIALEDVVPGEFLRLRAGDLVPGDVKVLQAKDFFVSEASLTGESIPLEKFPLKILETQNYNTFSEKEPAVCFMGSSVVSGTAIVMVEKIGSDTMFGKLAEKLASAKSKTAFQIGKLLMASMLPIVFVLSGLIQGDWFQGFLFAVGFAVGLTPEMLPMIVNPCLAKGAIYMSKHKAIVKKLDSIIDLGSMNILCTDKTGTLTQNKVVLVRYLDLFSNSCTLPLEMAFMNSSHQTGFRNLIDEAVITHYNSIHQEQTLFSNKAVKIDEIPFDFVRRRMSVVLKENNQTIMISKGAIEEMLDICVSYHQDGQILEMTGEIRQKALDLSIELNTEGLRVVAVGYRYIANDQTDFGPKDEKEMIFAGLIAFLDPPKESTKQAIQELIQYGVQVKVLTGDTPQVCKKVCQEINLPVDGICTTFDLEGKSDDEIANYAHKCTIFAKLTPLQKAQIVNTLKNQGNVVGFLGDGINDAPALKDSSVGISVDEAVEVAKETADIILLEKSLMVLVDGVIEGRRTYCNTIKYIKLALSSNFGNVFSVLVASAWLPFIPMLPLQIVVQNMLYDFSQTVIPWDNVDKEFVKVPRTWNVKSLLQFTFFFGPISSIFDITTFTFCWFVYGCATNPDACAAEFQTSWFLEGLITQTLIVHFIRSEKIPFIQTTANWRLILSTILACLAAIIIATTPLGNWFEMHTPRIEFYFYLVAQVVGYFVLATLGKMVYLKIFKTWM